MWLVIVGVAFGVGLLPAYFFIAFQRGEVERALGAEEAVGKAYGIVEFEAKVRAINQRLGLIIDREKKRKEPSPFVSEAFSRSPSGVNVTLITMSDSLLKANVSGTALTRSALLQFVSSLRASPTVKSVYLPIEKILKEEDITFTLEIETAL